MSGIYIHIPFCKQSCFYCDFHFSTSLKKKDELIFALIKELEIRKDELKNNVVETIYFGGGTPSLLSNKELKLLINAVYKNYIVIDNPEITLEANPDDLSEKKIITLTKTPINRLSIGIQSFFEVDLKMMNRAHSVKQAKNCLSIATNYFKNITIDLIYGIPNMSNKRWKENLQITFNYGINHISSYALTVEPKTALASFIKQKKYPNLEEKTAVDHFNILVSETKKNGFIHYETSNFGKPMYLSKHNTNYWLGKKYIGIGPSAHSYNKTHRSWNISNNSKYIKSIQTNILPKKIEKLTKEDRFNEYIMTSLRTIWGISLLYIEDNFGLEFKGYLIASTQKFISQKLLIMTNETYQHFSDKQTIQSLTSCNDQIIKTTQKGKFLVDGIASELFIIN